MRAELYEQISVLFKADRGSRFFKHSRFAMPHILLSRINNSSSYKNPESNHILNSRQEKEKRILQHSQKEEKHLTG